ncbi:MAG: ketoacyl-ACP synthase III [Acidobacteriota bacterium]|nr:ketoacyl-ACP synthase III [Acidobacteriota bacterium]
MPERPIGVLGLGAYVPDRVMTNDEWAEHVDTSDEWIFARTGIKTRRIAAEDQTTVDLAAAAAERALADAKVAIGEIDEIIVATDTPEVFIPDTASYLQNRLGAREVPAFDLAGSGCAGFILGLDVARSRAQTGDRKILLVGVELLTRLMDWKDRATCVLFGDAAGAAVIGSGEGAAEILGFTAGTDGTQAEILGLEVGGTRAPFTLDRAQRRDHKKVVMKGREVFREAVTRMGSAAKEVLAQANVVVDDVKLVIPHQANLRIINAVQKALAIPDDKIHVNVQDYGNTGSASVPLALWEARNQGQIDPGDLVLLTAFGAGFHWAAALLRF